MKEDIILLWLQKLFRPGAGSEFSRLLDILQSTLELFPRLLEKIPRTLDYVPRTLDNVLRPLESAYVVRENNAIFNGRKFENAFVAKRAEAYILNTDNFEVGTPSKIPLLKSSSVRNLILANSDPLRSFF